MNTEPVFIPQGYYYTVQEVASLRGLRRRTVQKWIDKKWIPSISTGIGHLIPAEAIKDFSPPKQGPKPKVQI